MVIKVSGYVWFSLPWLKAYHTKQGTSEACIARDVFRSSVTVWEKTAHCNTSHPLPVPTQELSLLSKHRQGFPHDHIIQFYHFSFGEVVALWSVCVVSSSTAFKWKHYKLKKFQPLLFLSIIYFITNSMRFFNFSSACILIQQFCCLISTLIT